jgi:glutamyl-tRNA reductase
MPTSGPELFLLGSTHRTAPLALRERLAIPPARLDTMYDLLRGPGGLGLPECLVLNTCNRVELYGVASDSAAVPPLRARLLEHLGRFHLLDPAELGQFVLWKEHEAVVTHVFDVAAGLDSQMVGETEIFGQIKDSYSDAARRGAAGPVLNRVFQKSFQAAKWARTHTPIGRGAVSVGSVAAELAARIFGDPAQSHLLLLGAGEVGQSALQALRSRGAQSVTIASRTLAHAQELAGPHEGAAVELARVPALLTSVDIVLGALTVEHPFLTRAQLAAAATERAGRPLFVIDLAVPRNIAPDAAGLDNVYLYNLDDLAAIANENLKSREAAVNACRETLADKARQVWESLRGRV